MWEIEYTDEFESWWRKLNDSEQISIAASVDLLEKFGTTLRFPHCSGIIGSKHAHLRELRVQHAGNPYRILYAFDPRRCAILLIGGNKSGDKRWYEKNLSIADQLYQEHLQELEQENIDEQTIS